MVARPQRVPGPVHAPFDPQVLIPYSQLVDLLEASERLGGIEQDMKRVLKMQDALRSQMAELMIAFGDLKRFVSD